MRGIIVLIVALSFAMLPERSMAQSQIAMRLTLENGNKVTGEITSRNDKKTTIKTLDGSLFVLDNLSIKSSIAITPEPYAQGLTMERIYLKNGSVINGDIVSNIQGVVKIRTADGAIWEFSGDEINKVIKTALNEPSVEKVCRWEHTAAVGFGISLDKGNMFQTELKYIASYRVIPIFAIGVGLKSDWYFQPKNTVNLLSPMLHLSLRPWADKVCYPRLGVDVGYGIYSSFATGVGAYVNPYVSSVVYRSSALDIALSLGYKYQNIARDKQSINSLTLGVSFVF